MSDIARVVFDADLEPLDKKVEEGKKKIDNFVSDAEDKTKGIKLAGDTLSPGALGSKPAVAGQAAEAASALGTQAAANTAVAGTAQAATVAETEQAAAATGVAVSSEAAAAGMASEASAATALTGALAAATAAEVALIATIGSVVLAGAGLVLYASKDRELSEQKLIIEENIASSQNRRILGLREEVSEYERIVELNRQALDLDNKRTSLVKAGDVGGIEALRRKTTEETRRNAEELARLKEDLRTAERSLEFERNRPVRQNLLTEAGLQNEYSPAAKRQNVAQATNRLEETKKRIGEVEADLKRGTESLDQYDRDRQSITENDIRRRSENFQNAEKFRAEELKAEEQKRIKLIESAKQGRAEVERIAKGYRLEFVNLYAGAATENPFAQRMLENARSVETLREKLQGAGPELQKTALSLLQAANAAKSYTIQIDSAFQTIDLRAQVDRFRNPTQKELSEDFSRKFNEFRRTSNSTNPDVIYQFRREAQEILDTNRIRNQRVIDQKLDVADRAKTPAERAIADRAVISFAGGLNPDDLTRGERSRIADAFERSAARNETRQEEALTIYKDVLTTLRSIDKRGEVLTGVANKEGREGVERAIKVDINLKDDTSDKKVTASSATSTDVSEQYKLPIGGPGGSNY